MALGLGIAILIAITVGMILLRMFAKTAFKIFSIIWFVLFLAGIAFSLLVYADVKNMRDACPELPPVFLAVDDGDMLAGMKLNTEGDQETTTMDMFLTGMDEYQAAYDEDEFKAMLEERHCKIAMFEIDIFQNFSDVKLSEDFSIPTDVIIDVIKSDSPIDVLVDYQADEEDMSSSEKNDLKDEIRDELGTPVQLKGFLFAALIATATDQEGPGFLIKNFNEGNIRVRKETITFKFMKYMPYSLFDEAIEKMMPKEGENGASG